MKNANTEHNTGQKATNVREVIERRQEANAEGDDNVEADEEQFTPRVAATLPLVQQVE